MGDRGDERYWPKNGQEVYSGAVIPARPTSPPPPPPVASGAMPRDMAKRSTVDVTGAREALVVGPHDVLIISYPGHTTMEDLYAMRERLRDSDLRDGQILLIAGAEKIVKVEGDEPRAYVRPHATLNGETA